jgi:hypothetical protein
MAILKIYRTIQEQFSAVHVAVEKIALHPDDDHLETISSLKRRMSDLYALAFEQLLAGQALPFFRQNFIEVSAAVFRLSGCLEYILRLKHTLPVRKTAQRPVDAGIFGGMNDILAVYSDTWKLLGGEMNKAGMRVREARGHIQELEDRCRLRQDAHDQKLETAVCRDNVIDSLYSLDLSIRKLIVILKI